VFLPVDVNHKQHGNSSWLEPDRADRVPALLSRCRVDSVRNDETSLVLEDERAISKETPPWFR